MGNSSCKGISVEDIDTLWTKTSSSLKETVTTAVWQMWLSKLVPVDISGDNLTLGVPNIVIQRRIVDRFQNLICDEMRTITGRDYHLTIEVIEELEPKDAVGETTQLPVQIPATSMADMAAAERSRDSVKLNPSKTFESFVPASSNRLAHAAALTVAETPGRSYNPLFIYGPSGLGKTHLLHAIGNWVTQNYPTYRVLYVTTETFMNDFVEAIRTKSNLSFKNRYRECDVLLIDDIQFIQNKEQLQEELFHTYNDLHAAGKQIVITSDRAPRNIETLEDRLRSRLLSGLSAEIDAPELETRLAILRSKASHARIELPDDVGHFIATNVKDNIRELEGALTRVVAFASLNGEVISLELAQRVLSDISAEPKMITPEMILEAVARHYDLDREELVGPRRARPLVAARHVAMYLIRNLTDYSYPSIGKLFGGRDHSTCISAVEKIESQMTERGQIYENVNSLIHLLKGN